MKLYDSDIFAGSLNVLDVDDLAVDVEAELLEFFCNLQATDAAIDDACAACLSVEAQANCVQLLCESFCVCLDLSELDGLLLEFLGEDFLSAFAGDNALALRNQIPPYFTSSNRLRKAAERGDGHA